MITSAANRPWPGDVSLADTYEDVGLPVPSVVRTAKIATIESRRPDPIGRLPEDRLRAVESAIRMHLGFN